MPVKLLCHSAWSKSVSFPKFDEEPRQMVFLVEVLHRIRNERFGTIALSVRWVDVKGRRFRPERMHFQVTACDIMFCPFSRFQEDDMPKSPLKQDSQHLEEQRHKIAN